MPDRPPKSDELAALRRERQRARAAFAAACAAVESAEREQDTGPEFLRKLALSAQEALEGWAGEAQMHYGDACQLCGHAVWSHAEGCALMQVIDTLEAT